MGNEEQLHILRLGAEAWNQWRSEHSVISPDLSEAQINGIRLNGANLSYADLNRAIIHGGSFNEADLRGANLSGVVSIYSDLSGADLSDADLTYAHLISVHFSAADLGRANLENTLFSITSLDEANFHQARMGTTVFSDADLREAKGLETVRHIGPSSISIDTIYRSEGKIPEIFLRGCGVPEDFIVHIPALVAAIQPIQFYSCFISYSSKDQKFAERLHADLQNKGVRCWYAPEHLKIGERIRVGIDESIRVHDKLLLILSQNSIKSGWVEKEVETAMEREQRQRRTILFPIRLDDEVLSVESGWAADIRRSRNIGDFGRWKSHDTYSKAFERLLRDLKAGI